MPDLPRVEIPQLPVPGLGPDPSRLVLHPCTERNFTQRITIARRAARQTNWRYHDVALTRAQVLELIDYLIDRVDLMTDDVPGDDRESTRRA
jgi:hypothetical protein